MSATIVHVQQLDPNGCAVAALAMVTGQDYEEVREAFPSKNFACDGVTFISSDQYLASQGYAIARLWRHDHDGQPRAEWPPAPWADVHLVQVMTVDGNHVLVMLRDGTVLDPRCPGARTLTDPVYAAVSFVAAVYRVPEGPW